MPNLVSSNIARKGDTVTCHVAGAATHPELHAAAIKGIARALEAQGYLKLRSISTEPEGAMLTYTVVKNPLPLLFALVAFMAGGLATAGTAYTIDKAVGHGSDSTETGGLFNFSPSTYLLAGLAAGFYFVTKVRRV